MIIKNREGGFMASRMEKYYKTTTDSNSRTSKNAGLYDEIYDNVKYSNVEEILKIEKTNEIDIAKIKDFIKEYEEQKNHNHKVVKKVVLDQQKIEEDPQQYDLKQMIDDAKKIRPKDEKERYVHSIKYQYITNKLNEVEDSDIKLDDLTNIEALQQLGDCELSLDLLDSLKDDEFLVEEAFIKKDDDKEEDMDDLFYTNSMKFSKEDFEELDDINKNLKKNNIWITILVFIILVIAITTCLFLFQDVL